MTYAIITPAVVQEQIQALPPAAKAKVSEALRAIELVPFSAGTAWRTRHNADVPDEDIPIRQLCFGPPGSGFIHYLILQTQDAVELLDVFWTEL